MKDIGIKKLNKVSHSGGAISVDPIFVVMEVKQSNLFYYLLFMLLVSVGMYLYLLISTVFYAIDMRKMDFMTKSIVIEEKVVEESFAKLSSYGEDRVSYINKSENNFVSKK